MTLCVFVQNRCSPSGFSFRDKRSCPCAPFSHFCSPLVRLSSLASVLPPAGRQCLYNRGLGVCLCVCVFSGLFGRRPQLKPSPAPLGLWMHRSGSVMPLPSGPRPIPGHQPMFCSIRFPTFESGIGGTPSPTTPTQTFKFIFY